MEELGWTASDGYMTAVELMTYLVPEDPTSPVQVGGYIMACAAFYERGYTDFSTLCYSSTAWSCITSPLHGSYTW
jgi:hypothetical protein